MILITRSADSSLMFPRGLQWIRHRPKRQTALVVQFPVPAGLTILKSNG